MRTYEYVTPSQARNLDVLATNLMESRRLNLPQPIGELALAPVIALPLPRQAAEVAPSIA